ncbi:MAG: SxtJ family membrane protein [Phycisphaerae bacterium]
MALIKINFDPSKKDLRQFALIWFPAFIALVGVLTYTKGQAHTAAWAIWIAGAAISVIGLAAPAFMRIVFVGLTCLTFPIGWVVSHVILGVVFFVVMTPMGWVMRLTGWDPMHRTFDPSAKSYWIAHNPGANTARYFRQS